MSELIENQLYRQLSKARKKVIGLERDFAKVLSANTNIQEQLARAEKVVDEVEEIMPSEMKIICGHVGILASALVKINEALAKYKEGK